MPFDLPRWFDTTQPISDDDVVAVEDGFYRDAIERGDFDQQVMDILSEDIRVAVDEHNEDLKNGRG